MKSQVISIDDQRLAQKKEKKLVVLPSLATYIGYVSISVLEMVSTHHNTLETKTNWESTKYPPFLHIVMQSF